MMRTPYHSSLIYARLNSGNEIAVTDKKEQVTQDGQDRFTSLLAIYTACKCLKKIYRKQRGTLDIDPSNVVPFQQVVSAFFDFAIDNEPSLNRYYRQHTTTPQAERVNNRSLFFRPVGLEVLARLYAYFHTQGRLPVLAAALTQLQFENPGGILDGVLWSAGRIEASAKARNAAVKLCLYLFGELAAQDEPALLVALREVTKNHNYSLPPKPRIQGPASP